MSEKKKSITVFFAILAYGVLMYFIGQADCREANSQAVTASVSVESNICNSNIEILRACCNK